MTTTSLHLGCAFCATCTRDCWGDVSPEQAQILADALVEKFEELAQEKTGDPSILWLPKTSEIIYECMGETTEDYHWSTPKHERTSEEVDWLGILDESYAWVAENMEDLLADTKAA